MGLFYTPLFLRDRHRIRLVDKSGPNDNGSEEYMQWLAFRWAMRCQSGPKENEDKPYPFLSYAIALGEDRPWMYSGISEALFPNDAATDSVRRSDSASVFRPADGFFIGWIAADYVTGDTGHSGIDIDGDMDLDIDLSI